MKKTIPLENLDCANCAAKMERAISSLEGVTSARVNFMSQKLVLEAPDEQFPTILESAKKAAKKIEPDIELLV